MYHMTAGEIIYFLSSRYTILKAKLTTIGFFKGEIKR